MKFPQCTWILITIVVPACFMGGTGPQVRAVATTSPPLVQTRVAYVTESRALIFATNKTPYAQAISRHLGLTVCLQVVSPLLQNPNFYHHLRIITEVLNTGHTLRPMAPRFQQVVPVQCPVYERMQQAGEVGFPLLLRFAAPSPKAAAIRKLSGAVDVAAGGKITTITVAHPLERMGQPLSDTGLRAAHIRMRIISVFKARHSRFLIVEIMAPAGVFQSITMLQKGKAISGGYIMVQLPKGIDKLMLPLTANPGPQAVLQLKVLTGWREYRIPFTLNNIPLPAAPPVQRLRP
ncbi:MAG: hypothetical protein ACP5I8_00560 [Phycisphaerae bacterium]